VKLINTVILRRNKGNIKNQLDLEHRFKQGETFSNNTYYKEIKTDDVEVYTAYCLINNIGDSNMPLQHIPSTSVSFKLTTTRAFIHPHG
jgi:hypothetical protein